MRNKKSTKSIQLAGLAWKNLRRHKNRVIQCVAAVAVSVTVICLLFGIIGGFEHELKTNIRKYIAGDARIRDAEYEKYHLFRPSHLVIRNSKRIEKIIRDLPEVTAVSRRLQIPASMVRGEDFEPLVVVGMDFENEKTYQNIETMLIKGTFPKNMERRMIVGTGLAKSYDLEIGDKITIFGTTVGRVSNAMTFVIAGIVEYPVPHMNKSSVYIPLGTATVFFKAKDVASEILVQTDKRSNKKMVKDIEFALSEVKGQSFEITPWNKVNIFATALVFTRVVYVCIAAIFFFLSGLVVSNTVAITVQERMYEMGVLAAMGFTSQQLRRIMGLENAYVISFGAFVGLVVGTVVVVILAHTGLDVGGAKSYGENAPITTVLYPRLSFLWTTIAIVYAFGAINAIAQFPLRKIKKMKIVKALHSTV